MSKVDEQSIRDRLTVMFDGWSPGTGKFTMERVESLYDRGSNFLAFDTLMPTTSIMDGWPSFLYHWEQAISGMRRFECQLEDILRLEVQGDLAWTALLLSVDAELDDGHQQLSAEQQVTLIWQRHEDGWRIVHEHLSGPVRPESRIDE